MGARLGRPLDHRHHLTIQPNRPRGNTPTWKNRTDRPINRAQITTDEETSEESIHNGPRNQCRWIRAELVAGDKPKHFAAFFDRHHLIKRKDLELDHRIATLSQRGVNLLMQRWVHHNSRMIVPTLEYQKVTSAQYDEADIIEEWCLDRDGDGVSLDEATVEIDTWLTGDRSASAPRNRLQDPQQRSAVRREVRTYLRELRA